MYVQFAKMDIDSTINTDGKERLKAEVADDSCSLELTCNLELTEVVSLARNTDGSCVNGDWSADINQEYLAVVKQELDDVRWIYLCYLYYYVTHTHTHTQPFYGHLGFCPGLPG